MESCEKSVVLVAKDTYVASAAAYDLFVANYRKQQLEALETLRPHLQPDAGPVLDIGAGSVSIVHGF